MERTERSNSRRVVIHDGDGRPYLAAPLDDASIGELFKRVTADASLLMRQEIALAKAEVKESGVHLKQMIRALAIAVALAVPGALALTAFLVIALGDAIDSYWASALIIGALLLGGAGILARRGLARVADGKVALDRTAASLGEDARWGKEELRAFKRELTA